MSASMSASRRSRSTPPDLEMLDIVIEQLASDRLLLFATDYPHWHFDGDAALPLSMASDLAPKILYQNALDTYSRLSATAPAA
jgi:uncharacterized protein